MLSILVPVYNENCVQLITGLHQQCTALNIVFEIIVLDDNSTKFKDENRAINQLENCKFIESAVQIGPAKIRNAIAKKANYDHLLFIDSDAVINRNDFIENYIKQIGKAQVIVGGMGYSKLPPKENALRWYYGTKREFIPAEKRNKKPYHSFISFNFMIQKQVFLSYNFDEKSLNIKKKEYGHEDTLLGIRLGENKISILHIDNQLEHHSQETNEVYLTKTIYGLERSLTNPKFLEESVIQHIKLLRYFYRLKAIGAVGILSFIYKKWGENMKNRLFKPSPPIYLFDFFRLTYLSYFYKKEHKK